ncbi:MAG: response regulator transcription factor, partial [Chloroflexaceae bacterium]|nr:response regulator transcription factor [Chloroflexaceae bacterium]
MTSEPGPPVSEREREILELVATGATNQQIANQLHISVHTVKVHMRNIFEKMGVASRTEASMYALQQGWIVLDRAAAADTQSSAVEALPPAEDTPSVGVQRGTRIGPSTPPAADCGPCRPN